MTRKTTLPTMHGAIVPPLRLVKGASLASLDANDIALAIEALRIAADCLADLARQTRQTLPLSSAHERFTIYAENMSALQGTLSAMLARRDA